MSSREPTLAGNLVLVGRGNPDGWSLDMLADQLIAEVESEQKELRDKGGEEAIMVRASNTHILNSLRLIANRARDNRRIRDTYRS